MRRPTDRQIVTHLLAFIAGLAVAIWALPALRAPLHAERIERLGEITAKPRKAIKPAANAFTTPSQADLNGRLIIPVQGIRRDQLSDTYTQSRSENRQHNAIDIMAPEGTPVLAADDGRIEKLHNSAAGGITIYQFNPERTYSYYYAHLSAYAPTLVEGALVRKGDVIGYVGHTGNASPEGPHLHFQLKALAKDSGWSDGYALNPYPVLMASKQP